VVQVINAEQAISRGAEGIADRIRHLVEAMNRLDLQIAGEVEVIKDYYA